MLVYSIIQQQSNVSNNNSIGFFKILETLIKAIMKIFREFRNKTLGACSVHCLVFKIVIVMASIKITWNLAFTKKMLK